jgi:hypothetical protein
MDHLFSSGACLSPHFVGPFFLFFFVLTLACSFSFVAVMDLLSKLSYIKFQLLVGFFNTHLRYIPKLI